MPAERIDGVAIATRVRAKVAADAAALKALGITPGLTVVLVGDDPASAFYVGAKEKACKEAGMNGETIRLPADTPEAELLAVIDRLNADPAVHGILVQMPVPKHMDPQKVIRRIDPMKDVDGFHPVNAGKVIIGDADGFAPCTPAGVQVMLVESGVDTSGKEAVILGRSTIVGKPMAALLIQSGKGADCTVTICHSRTQGLAQLVGQADIVVGAVGKPEFIRADWIRDGAVVVDAGYHPGGIGDIELAPLTARVAAYTPVPGGVGPMTINTLILQTVQAAERTLA